MKRAIQKSDLARLDAVIANLYPSLKPSQVRTVRSRIIQYIASGLEDGFDIALVKAMSDEEIMIRILKLQEEDL